MSDLIDTAQEKDLFFLESSLSFRQITPEIKFSLICLNCNAPLKSGRWCDKDCCEDWEKRERLKTNGEY